jgi:hypothetical protein
VPEYLPLGAFRQGLLPGDCSSCAWWQTVGAADSRGPAAAAAKHEWMAGLEHEWGTVGLLIHEPAPRRDAAGSAAEVNITASIHFAPAAALPRLRELPFPPLPPLAAVIFCLRTSEDAPRWVAKRLIHKAIYELRSREVEEVYAVARQGSRAEQGADCRFFAADLLAESGFTEVAGDASLSLMRVDNRGLITLVDHVETALRRIFTREEEPAPSPAAWAEEQGKVKQGAR